MTKQHWLILTALIFVVLSVPALYVGAQIAVQLNMIYLFPALALVCICIAGTCVHFAEQ